ncbi:MAG: DUF421 domain-containing protein [Candidatus Howiella sp.]|jgi:uncharacterized membrane protein YcaP (DUF421 family)
MLKDLLNVALTSIGSIVALFLLTKLMGNKQMSELNMFDYITGITIGSIAAEMATALESDFAKPLLSMVIYALTATVISLVASGSIRARRLINGRSVVLCKDGELYKKNFKKTRLDLNEFLTQCRVNGYFDLAEIELAMLEPNGRISILPKAENRPATPKDLNIQPKKSEILINVIIDGRVVEGNLRHTGNNRQWLENQLKTQDCKTEDIFLATCDRNNTLTVYRMRESAPDSDLFQ